MKNVLIVATIASFVECFEMNDISILQKKGCKVHLAANFENERGRDYIAFFHSHGVITHQICFQRSPASLQNFNCIRIIENIIEDEKIDLVHCHTPVGGVIGRLAARKSRKKGTKVIYTVHGLQFCKGETLSNWLVFYPIEKLMSVFADIIVTINHEDYDMVSQHFWNKRTYYIPGVGIHWDSFQNCSSDRNKIKRELGLAESSIIIFSSGELSNRKNHQVILRALALLDDSRVHYVIAGDGALYNYLHELAHDLNIENQVHLLGYRTDIKELLYASDIFAFPSKHEGLGISLLEAMACGLPCVATEVQGIKDLILDKRMLNSWNDSEGFAKSVQLLISDSDCASNEAKNNTEHSKNFDIKITETIMENIYNTVLEGTHK